MALSEKRLGEIALISLQFKYEKEGLKLDPRGIRREMHNAAKELKIPANEIAEFAKIMYKILYDLTIVELDKMIATSDRPSQGGQG